MQVASMHFKERAHVKLHDERLQHSLAKMKDKFVGKRRESLAELDDFEGTREAGRAIRQRALDDLDVWLELFERNAAERGAKVLFAQTPAEINKLVLDIAARHGVRKIIKSKSMVSEESALDHAVEGAGMTVVETDLGEYILQINDYEPPSHIIGPALHKSMEEVAELFHQKHGTVKKVEIEELCLEARGVLREHYLTADMGISGGNFFVAETGSVVLVTNEGNATLATTLPKVHIAISGIEKIVPTLEDVATLMRLLPRSATGQSISNYVDILTGPKGPGEFHGVEHMYFIIVDSRTHRSARERREGGAALHSLRRVHESLPGLPEHRRAFVRLGLSGTDRLDPDADVRRPRECARPAARVDVVQSVRRRVSRSRFRCRICCANCAKRSSARTCARGTSAPACGCGHGSRGTPACTHWRRGVGVRFLRSLAGRDGMIHKLPLGSGWTSGRDMPAPTGRTFRELYARRKEQGSVET